VTLSSTVANNISLVRDIRACAKPNHGVLERRLKNIKALIPKLKESVQTNVYENRTWVV